MNKVKSQNLKVKIIAILLTTYCLLLTTFSLSASAASSVDLTAVGTGAKAMGMGKAYIGLSDDVNAVFTNPAGLGHQKSWGITSMSTKLMDRVDYRVLGAAFSTQYGMVGVGYLSASTPAGFLTTDQASIASATPITYGSSVMIISFGKDMSDMVKNSGSAGTLSIGANYKLSSSNFSGTDGSSTGSSIDVGLLYKSEDKFSAGIDLQNISGSTQWNDGVKEDVSMSTRVGAAYNMDKTTVAIDVETAKNDTTLHGGVEYRPFDMLALRAGVNQTSVSASEKAMGMTAGVGVNVSGIRIDYAYCQDGGITDNSTSYVSVSFQPEVKKVAQVKKETKPLELIQPQVKPEVISPKASTDGVYRPAKKSVLSYYAGTEQSASLPAEMKAPATTKPVAKKETVSSKSSNSDGVFKANNKDILSYYK